MRQSAATAPNLCLEVGDGVSDVERKGVAAIASEGTGVVVRVGVTGLGVGVRVGVRDGVPVTVRVGRAVDVGDGAEVPAGVNEGGT